jgi:predicted RNA-binding protein (virulence factor B family)
VSVCGKKTIFINPKKRKMIRLGRYNRLIAFRETEYGWYLTDEDQSEEVLLPNKFVPKDIEQDQEIEVFIFNDSEDRATATTQKPTIELDSFGYLKVFDSSNFGAFMDMGLDRQLLVPFSEQRNRLEAGEWYIIFMYLDGETDRLVGSNKWMNYVEVEDIDLEIGQEVDLLVADRTDLGVKVIIDDLYMGLVFQNEIFKEIRKGDRIIGYVKNVREDGKIDVSLQKQGYENVVGEFSTKILKELRERKGFMDLTDKSPPGKIYAQLEMSKKNFKKSIGALYRQKIIRIEKDGIYLN